MDLCTEGFQRFPNADRKKKAPMLSKRSTKKVRDLLLCKTV
jgi:hypothetical protein